MKNKRRLLVVLAVILGNSPLQVSAASVSDNNIIENNIEIENETNQGENAILAQNDYIKSDLDYNTPAYEPEIVTYADLPTSFPDNLDAYPSNRDQNPYGTCWAFASLGLAEFDLINDGSADKNIDLSELQLAYFTYNSVLDPLGGTEGDSARYYNENTATPYLNYGGNYEMASRRLAQWYGPVDETVAPYGQADSTITGGLDESCAYGSTVAHLENAYLINIKKNSDAVKRQIMEHGAAGIMYYHNEKAMGWNDALGRYAYYDTDFSGGGHAVMAVGWDDNFSKDNFTRASKPSKDGAWLIRNSWGLYANYFWMSYETASLADTAWIFDFSKENGYDNNYQLDGGINVYPDGNHLTLANVFKTKQTEGIAAETLSAVSLSFTRAAGVNYTIEIYTDLKDETDPLSGIKQEYATTEGTTAYAGIYTIPLENAVILKPGSAFAVVVKVGIAALDYEQATSIATGENLSTIIWDCKVSLNNKKSLYYSGGKFQTFSWGNYCIKAFTTDVEGDEPQETVGNIQEKNGILYYFRNGVIDTGYTGTAEYRNTIYYCENGKVTYTYAGFGEYENQWYYFENSEVAKETEDIVYNTDRDEWWYIKDGKFQSTTETIAHNKNGWYYVKDGVVDFGYTGVAENKNGIYYCEKGKVWFAYTGFGEYKDQWYYFVNSAVAKETEDIIYNTDRDEWWYIKDGKFQSTTETIAHNKNGWYYVKNGVVDFGYTGVAENKNGIYYCEKGKVWFAYTGFGEYKGQWYYFVNSAVAKETEDIVYNADIDEWWYIKDGKFQSTTETIAHNKNGWYYVKDGVVDFGYTGAAENKNGIYYCEKGRVWFNFNGYAEYKGRWYYFKNSAAVSST